MSITQMLKDIAKDFGEESTMFFGDFKQANVERISTGLLSLDLAIWWGIPEGRILEIYGPSSSGKTTLSIKFLAEVQKAYPEKKVAFIDVENALDPVYAEKLWLNMKELIFCQPNSAEEALIVMEKLCESGEIKAIILDSVAQLTPNKELNGSIWDAEMGMRARLMSQALRKIVWKANDNKCTCFFINQVRTNIGQMYGNPETRPWGNALPFAASIIIRTSSKQIDDYTTETTMKIKKNKVWVPFKETKVILKFGEGFDYLQDLITTWLETGVLSRAWAYYSFWDKKRLWEALMREEISADKNLQDSLSIEIKKLFSNWEMPEAPKKSKKSLAIK